MSRSSRIVSAFLSTRNRQLSGQQLDYNKNIFFYGVARSRSRNLSDKSVETHSSETLVSALKDIDWVRDCVAQALNKAFDPVAVSKQRALAKLKNLEKKKKGDGQDSTMGTIKHASDLSIEESESITFNSADAMVTVATKLEFGDYQCNAAMNLAKSVSMAPRYCSIHTLKDSNQYSYIVHIDLIVIFFFCKGMLVENC